MKFFPYVWGRGARESGTGEPVDTPAGATCLSCGKLFGLGDLGLFLPHLGPTELSEEPWHRECFIESIFGPGGEIKMLTEDADGRAVVEELPWKKN